MYLSLYCKGSKRVTQGLHVRGSWRPNLTEIFWHQSYGRQRCVFLVLQGCSTEGPGPTVLGDGFIYCILSAFSPDPNSSGPQAPSAWCGFPYHISSPTALQLSWLLFNSSALFYLQTPMRRYGHASTPPQFLPISGDRDVSLPLSLEWPVWSSSSGNNCHAVHRSLSSGASLWSGTFTLFHIISRARFPLITAIGMCHLLLVHHLGMAFLAGSKGQNTKEYRRWKSPLRCCYSTELWVQAPVIHFCTNTIEKGMKPFIPHLCLITLLMEWHWIAYEIWYVIKQRNQTKVIFTGDSVGVLASRFKCNIVVSEFEPHSHF